VAATCAFVGYAQREYHLYINGAEVPFGGSDLGGTILALPRIYIGAGNSAGLLSQETYFNGVIDEVAIYGSVLPPEEIRRHYENGLRGMGYEDVPPPEISVSVNPALPASGWFTTDVTINWTVTGPVTSSTGCDAVTVNNDTPGATFACSATTAGGTTTKSYTVKRDATPPAIVFSGNTYTVDQTVNVTCSASDALSGIATSSCPSASGEAYTFAGAPTVLTATATDVAGNGATRSTTIAVPVTRNGLCALVNRWVSSSGVAHSLCVKLDQPSHESFKNELSAQTGKKITAEHVATLARLVDLLPPE